ncbi:hypothetical protein NYE76_31045, partial [Paenibacillus sp. FSL M7-0831]
MQFIYNFNENLRKLVAWKITTAPGLAKAHGSWRAGSHIGAKRAGIAAPAAPVANGAGLPSPAPVPAAAAALPLRAR